MVLKYCLYYMKYRKKIIEIQEILQDISDTIGQYNIHGDKHLFLKDIKKLSKRLAIMDDGTNIMTPIYGMKQENGKNDELYKFDRDGYEIYKLLRSIPSLKHKSIIHQEDVIIKTFFLNLLKLLYINVVWCGYNNTKNMKEFTGIINHITISGYVVNECYKNDYYCGRGFVLLQDPKDKVNRFLLLSNLHNTDRPDPYIMLQYEKIKDRLLYIYPEEKDEDPLLTQLLLHEYVKINNEEYKIKDLFDIENHELTKIRQSINHQKNKEDIIQLFEDELDKARDQMYHEDFTSYAMITNDTPVKAKRQWFRTKRKVLEDKMNKELDEIDDIYDVCMIPFQIILTYFHKTHTKTFIKTLSKDKKLLLTDYYRWMCRLYRNKNQKDYPQYIMFDKLKRTEL
jgi:hypothetical protein